MIGAGFGGIAAAKKGPQVVPVRPFFRFCKLLIHRQARRSAPSSGRFVPNSSSLPFRQSSGLLHWPRCPGVLGSLRIGPDISAQRACALRAFVFQARG